MWVEDFQKGLVVLKYVRKGLKFENNYCLTNCDFMNYSKNYCRLFGNVLYSKMGEECKQRLKICKDLFI